MQVKSAIVLVAAALLFWGWQTGLFLFAVPMAGFAAASTLTRRRLALTPRELARVWDVTLALVIGAVIYNRQTLSASGAVIAFLQWLPILLFPFVAIRLVSAEKESGALKLMLQAPSGIGSAISAKGIVILAD